MARLNAFTMTRCITTFAAFNRVPLPVAVLDNSKADSQSGPNITSDADMYRSQPQRATTVNAAAAKRVVRFNLRRQTQRLPVPSQRRPGDWTCPCSNVNFAFRCGG